MEKGCCLEHPQGDALGRSSAGQGGRTRPGQERRGKRMPIRNALRHSGVTMAAPGPWKPPGFGGGGSGGRARLIAVVEGGGVQPVVWHKGANFEAGG